MIKKSRKIVKFVEIAIEVIIVLTLIAMTVLVAILMLGCVR